MGEDLLEDGHTLELLHQVRKGYRIRAERIQLVCQLIRVDLSLDIKFLDEHVQLVVAYDAVLVVIYLPEQHGQSLYSLAVFLESVLEC